MSSITEFWQGTDERVKDLSHYRGVGRWAEENTWLEIGQDIYRILDHWLSRRVDDYANLVVAEYGCGGGSESIELCKHFRHVYGIDISEANLAECVNQVNSVHFTPIIIDIDNPEKLDIGKVDLFLSVSVFQHFPSKDYGQRIVELAHRILKPNGYALIQTRYDDGNPVYASKSDNYTDNVVTFTSYQHQEFRDICGKAGFKVLGSFRNPTNHYEYFFLGKS